MIKNLKQRSGGQVALVVMVVMAISMAVSLAMSRKVEIETKIDKGDELLKQAFNTAESGIDYYLSKGETTYTEKEGVAARVSVSSIAKDGESWVDFGEMTPVNETITYWLVGHDSVTGELNFSDNQNYDAIGLYLCWPGNYKGSIKADFYYRGPDGVIKVDRSGYNLGDPGDEEVANFIDQATIRCGDGRGFWISTNRPNPLLLAVTPIFKPGRFRLNLTGAFPSQGVMISSTGSAHGVNRTVKVARRWDVPQFLIEGVGVKGNISSN